MSFSAGIAAERFLLADEVADAFFVACGDFLLVVFPADLLAGLDAVFAALVDVPVFLLVVFAVLAGLAVFLAAVFVAIRTPVNQGWPTGAGRTS